MRPEFDSRQVHKFKMKDCIFCKIVKKEIPAKIVYEDEYAFAFLSIEPSNIGHTLVIPKKHFETIDEINKKDFDKITESILKISKSMMKLGEGLNVIQNNKKAGGQIVPHLHFHLIPRYEGDGHTFELKTKKVDEEENNKFLAKIKKLLKG